MYDWQQEDWEDGRVASVSRRAARRREQRWREEVSFLLVGLGLAAGLAGIGYYLATVYG